MNEKKKNWFVRHKILTGLLIFIIIAVIATGASNTEEQKSNSSTEASQSQSNISANTEEETNETKNLKVGDSTTMGSLTHTLHSVRWDPGMDYMEPETGKKYLVADIELKNSSDKSESLSTMLMWKLLDSENRTNDMALGANTKGSLDGELGPNRSLRGEIAFTVAEGNSNWELIFEPNLFGFGQAIYSINESEIK